MHFFQRIIFSLIGYTLVFWGLDSYYHLTKNLIGGLLEINGGITSYLILAILFGVITSTIKPLLMLITSPLRFITLGLFTIIVNGLLLWILEVSSSLIPAMSKILHIEGWQTYIVVGIILSSIHGIIHWFER